MSKLILLVLLFGITATQFLYSQNLVFSYDEAGNRIARESYGVYDVNDVEQEQDFEYLFKSMSSREDMSVDNAISVYPNPTKGIFYAETNGSYRTITFRLYDMTGRLLTERKSDGSKEVFDISGYPTGVYLLWTGDKENGRTHKIVKE